jgi:hypothetical protein
MTYLRRSGDRDAMSRERSGGVDQKIPEPQIHRPDGARQSGTSIALVAVMQWIFRAASLCPAALLLGITGRAWARATSQAASEETTPNQRRYDERSINGLDLPRVRKVRGTDKVRFWISPEAPRVALLGRNHLPPS